MRESRRMDGGQHTVGGGEEEEEEEEVWRYVFEALDSVHSLRLFLFKSMVCPLDDCLNFGASVKGVSLICLWNAAADGASHRLRVPLPVCLLDHSVPVRVWTRKDHVEVRLGLLSLDPFLHALQLTLDQESPEFESEGRNHKSEDAKRSSFESDTQALESNGRVLVFCRNCSCKLTNTPFRQILEVPSADWREVAEHFYGNCCCASFGAQAESLVAKFQQLLTPSEGACLVASTICIVHEENVTSYVAGEKVLLQGDAAHLPCSSGNNTHPTALEHLGSEECSGVDNGHVMTGNHEDECRKHFGLVETSPLSGDGQSFGGERDCTRHTLLVTVRSQRSICNTEDVQTSGTSKDGNKVEGNISRDTPVATESEYSVHSGEDCSILSNRNCQTSQAQFSRVQKENLMWSNIMSMGRLSVADSMTLTSVNEYHNFNSIQNVTGDPRWSSCCSKEEDSTAFLHTEVKTESLGNAFMTGPGSVPELFDWEPFFCHACTSLIGARHGDSSKHGIQFFKCQISTDESSFSSNNVFRQHTLERVFTHELEVNTESTSSYRYVVRSLRTGAALLQLVLLNQDASVCSGGCHAERLLEDIEHTAPMLMSPDFFRNQCRSPASESNCDRVYQKQSMNISLDAVAKFMYSDCRALDSEKLRSIDRWAQLHKADEIYMLEEVAGMLIDLLNYHLLAYPPSCRSFQLFNVSHLRK